ncbi:MAG: transposase [Acidobacteriota bacterium]
MWNDTDIPLALLITFRAYGTWLHGDGRGSVDRHNNTYGSPRIAPIEHLENISRARLKHAPVKLEASHRRSIEAAIRETCEIRNWYLAAFNIRTNHVHIVATVGDKQPDLVLTAFKANATRHMREDGLWPFDHSPWAEKGSKRRLWNERHVTAAVDYVLFGQGDDLPKFD